MVVFIFQSLSLPHLPPSLPSLPHRLFLILSPSSSLLLPPSGKKYNELFPKDKKEKKPAQEQQQKQKKHEPTPKKAERKPNPTEVEEEEEDTPKPAKFTDPYAGLPPRYACACCYGNNY